MDNIGPFTFNCIRFFVGFLAVAPFVFIFEKKKINQKIKNRKDVLRNKSGSGWLTRIIKKNPKITYMDCLKTMDMSPLEAEKRKNKPRIEIRKILKNK